MLTDDISAVLAVAVFPSPNTVASEVTQPCR